MIGWIITFIQKYKMPIFIAVISLLALWIRYLFIDFESMDYKVFLSKWTEHLNENGGFRGLKDIKSDYNVPYLYLLAIVSYVPGKFLYGIKIISVIFDFIGAVGCFLIVQKIMNENNNVKVISGIVYAIILLMPTVVLNSAAWGQCDMIYSSFLIFSLYYMMDEKYLKSFILFGIAFAFKLQAIFLLPLYIVLYFNKKNFSILHFFVIPLVVIILDIPALILGRPVKELINVYFGQVNQTQQLVYNFPSVYNLLPDNSEMFRQPGIVLAVGIIGIMVFYLISINEEFNKYEIIELALLFILVETYFLPGMHERYMYLAEILSIIYLIIKKDLFIPIVINLISINCYMQYFFGHLSISMNVASIVQMLVIVMLANNICNNNKKIMKLI